MGNCYAYGLAKNKGSSSCLISPPGGWCFTACEGKALVSGMLIFAGGVAFLIGTALLFAGGSGMAGKLAEGAGAGLALIPGAELAGAAIARAGHKQSQQSKAFHADRSAARAQRKAGVSSAQGRQTPAQSQAETAHNRQIAKRPATTARERSATSNAGNDDFS
jgi:membrane-bound ClpP family serine protease